MSSSPTEPHPTAGGGRPTAGGSSMEPERACSRCRLFFDIDERQKTDSWWLCEPCLAALFGSPS